MCDILTKSLPNLEGGLKRGKSQEKNLNELICPPDLLKKTRNMSILCLTITSTQRLFTLTPQPLAFHHGQEKEMYRRPVPHVKVAYLLGGSGSTLDAVPAPRLARA